MTDYMATTKPINPLSPNDLAGAQAVIDSAAEVREYLVKCEKCTVDTTALLAQVDALEHFAKQVLLIFGGGQ